MNAERGMRIAESCQSLPMNDAQVGRAVPGEPELETDRRRDRLARDGSPYLAHRSLAGSDKFAG